MYVKWKFPLRSDIGWLEKLLVSIGKNPSNRHYELADTMHMVLNELN